MELDTLKMISEIVGGLTTQAVLLYWVFVERKRYEITFGAILSDWEHQRQREIDNQAASKSYGGGL